MALLRLGTFVGPSLGASCDESAKPNRPVAVSPADEGILNLAEAEAAPPFYAAVVGKPLLRRLHRKGGCGTDPNDLHIMEPVFELETAAYDVACKHC